jgi:hypothetical protein
MRADERREFQRLALNPAISGSLDSVPVSILEIGILGGRVKHEIDLDDDHGDLHFAHGGKEITMRCEVVRTQDSETGLRFVAALGDSGDRLREMLGNLVTIELSMRRNISREGLGPTIDGDKTIRGKDARYLCYRLEDGVWSRRRVFLPEQPPAGFTVARSEDSEEIQRLCRVYQASDAEGRRLVRLFAELSVSEAMEIPPQIERPAT